MFPTLFVILTFLVLYWFPIRRWMNRWGATPADLARVMAGDGSSPDPMYSGTTAITVNASPEHIWPWLVQIGYQRGGLYSYDWLDRSSAIWIARAPLESSRVSEPRRGDNDSHGARPKLARGRHRTRRALVFDMRNMGGFDWVWQFGLYPIDETRTQSCRAVACAHESPWARLLTYVIEPAGFVMTRRMLLGIKDRAETLRTARMRDVRATQRPAA